MARRILALLFLLGLLLSAAGSVQAQTARWMPDRGSLGIGQSAELQLILEGCAPQGVPNLPSVPGLSLEFAGSSASMMSTNFSAMSHRYTLTYIARAAQRGTVKIPGFEVRTDRGNVRVPPAEFEVGDATVGQNGTPLERIVQSRFQLPAQSVWAGEVFPLTYTLSINRGYNANAVPTIEWSPAPLLVEEWAKPELAEALVNGEARLNVNYRTRALVKAPGTVPLKPAQQLVNLQTGSATFGLFARPTMEQFAITTVDASVTVKPLPPQAPPEFSGAVGQFALTSKVVPVTAAVGEPITWTLELSGTGNWPDITGLPPRTVSRDFRVVQPQPKRSTKENTLFDGTLTEDVVLIPTKAGTYTLGPIRWTYFDPKTGAYRTIDTEKVTLTVTGAAPTAVPPPTSPVDPSKAAKDTPGTPSGGSLRAPPPAPALALRDPLSGEATALIPLGWQPVILSSVAASGGILVVWLTLALGRARRTDPYRHRRDASERLRRTVEAIATTRDPKEQRNLLAAWRRDTLTLLGLPASTPSAEILAKKIASTGPTSEWPKLWREADRALFGSRAALPDDWPTRARAAAAAQRVPAFSPVTALHPQNFLPCLLVLGLLIALASSAPAATPNGRTAYDQGQFPAAEKTWRERLTHEPTDWTARHNLSLALAQQDRWPEAAALATAAFVQRPDSEPVRWQLVLALQRAGYTPAEIAPFVTGHPLRYLAQWASPGLWKIGVIASSWLGAVAFCLWLARRFGAGPRWLHRLSLPCLVLAVAGASASLVSLKLFGLLAEENAAVVWHASVLRSIPTEADVSQKTTPVAAGSVVRIEKPFLGWRRIAFKNGQTGWIDAKDLIPVWRAP